MAQITEAALFEMLGRLFAEVKALTQENEVLRQKLAELALLPRQEE